MPGHSHKPLAALAAILLAACAAPVQPPKPEPASPPPLPLAGFPAHPATGRPVGCLGYRAILQEQLRSVPKAVGIRGVVTLRLLLAGDEILDVQAVAGPPEYRQHAVDAARHMKCHMSPGKPVTVRLDVEFAP